MGSQAFFLKKSSLQVQGFKHDRKREPYAEGSLLHDLVTFEFADEIGHQTPIINGYIVDSATNQLYAQTDTASDDTLRHS